MPFNQFTPLPGVGRNPWLGSFSFVMDGDDPRPDLSGSFFLYSPQSENDFAHPIRAMRQNPTGTLVAASLIFRIIAGGEVGTTRLSSVPGEESGSDEVTLIIDPLGYNVPIALQGSDALGLGLYLVPADDYWSFRGIYNPLTGLVNPGASVFSNEVAP